MSTSTNLLQPLPTAHAIRVFLIMALGYFLSTLMRTITATLSPVLVEAFTLTASDLGLLAGGYFMGFALTQLPMGRALDRHGPKRVQLLFLTMAVAGCLLFAVAQQFWVLWFARTLVGVGVSACLMAPLTGYRRWLSPETQIRANSWMLMTGALGMLTSTLPCSGCALGGLATHLGGHGLVICGGPGADSLACARLVRQCRHRTQPSRGIGAAPFPCPDR